MHPLFLPIGSAWPGRKVGLLGLGATTGPLSLAPGSLLLAPWSCLYPKETLLIAASPPPAQRVRDIQLGNGGRGVCSNSDG